MWEILTQNEYKMQAYRPELIKRQKIEFSNFLRFINYYKYDILYFPKSTLVLSLSRVSKSSSRLSCRIFVSSAAPRSEAMKLFINKAIALAEPCALLACRARARSRSVKISK